MQRLEHTRFLRVVLVVVLADYLVQISYYLHLYYLPHKAPPSLFGSLALTLTLAWFLAGYALVVRGIRSGFWILLAFLLVEFLFYLENELIQVTHGYAPFFHLQTRDPILFVVFAIGYLNFLAGAYFLYFLVRNRRTLGANRASQ